MRECSNLVDLEKRCKMSIWSSKSALIQRRTDCLKLNLNSVLRHARQRRKLTAGCASCSSSGAARARRRSNSPGRSEPLARASPRRRKDRRCLSGLRRKDFRQSVLRCINADFCDQILILQRFSSSTRFCTFAPLKTEKFSRKFVKILKKKS